MPALQPLGPGPNEGYALAVHVDPSATDGFLKKVS